MNGIYAFSCTGSFLSENNIYTDAEISEDEFAELKNRLFFDRSKEYLFNILAKKDYTESELRNKLRLRDVPQNIQDELIEYFKKKEFINEEQFLRNYLSYLIKCNKYSKQEIRKKVFNKGFSSEFKDISEKIINDIDESEIIMHIYEKLIKTRSEKQIKIYLSRKGFIYESVEKIIKTLNEEEL
ncbi:RecX family transcriptional regulator [candidate division WOR-3 bacterium]|nr:RecX family transcriptional regulator [candidate division WOR-3 bacterium]